MILNGWPSDKSVFDHAAYELLKWSSEHKDEYRGLVGRSVEKRSDLIFASRGNIPELSEYNKNGAAAEFEKHKVELEKEMKGFAGAQKI